MLGPLGTVPGKPLSPPGQAGRPEEPAAAGRAARPAETELTVGQLDLLARILETDRGAELDVEGRDPAWALTWLVKQLECGVPAQAGIVHEGKGRTVRILQLSNRVVECEGLLLAPPAFLASLRRVLVDGEYLARVGLS